MITECDMKNYTELTWKNKKEKSPAANVRFGVMAAVAPQKVKPIL